VGALHAVHGLARLSLGRKLDERKSALAAVELLRQAARLDMAERLQQAAHVLDGRLESQVLDQ